MMNDRLSYKLEKICPILKGVDVRIDCSSPLNLVCGEMYRSRMMPGEASPGYKSKLAIETMPESLYDFKKTETSEWEMYWDNEELQEFGEPPNNDRDFVIDTYYALINAGDIPEFIKESGEMINGEDRIDPIGDGKFHAAHVYVCSGEKVLPMGIVELIGRMNESRNMFLHLILDKKIVEKFIEEYEVAKQFFDNNPDMWSIIC